MHEFQEGDQCSDKIPSTFNSSPSGIKAPSAFASHISMVFIFLTLIFTALLHPRTDAQQPLFSWCSFSGNYNYTANSTCEANLKSLLSDLCSKTPKDIGFFSSTSGSDPDSVYGLALCRGDANSTVCRSCLDVVTTDAISLCPYNQNAVIWYDHCLLRYVNRLFATEVDNGNRVFTTSVNNVSSSDATRFSESLLALFHELRSYAPYKASGPPMFAAAEMGLGGMGGLDKLYGLVQCTRDITAVECDRCLEGILDDLPGCCAHAIGGRVLAPSCNFRYEVYPFYNWSKELKFPPIRLTESLASSHDPAVPMIDTTGNRRHTDAGKKRNMGIIKVLAIVIPLGATTASLIFFVFVCLRKGRSQSIESCGSSQDHCVDSLLFDSATIRSATNNFSPSNKLGAGGFGSVYKGILADGRKIAVKRVLTGSLHEIEQLKNEVVLLAKLQHRNLVRLIGACLEDEEKSIAYEFVQNRSLDTILFDPEKKQQFNWRTRFKIIKGIAQGLYYLHEESHSTVIHRDLKASNVLLDAEMNAKISDFGTARLFGGEQTQASTDIVIGTFGYMPPEYVMRGQFSIKSDVFSFGILLLQIITGRQNSDFLDTTNFEYSTDLLSYVWENWCTGSISAIVDPSLGGDYQQDEVQRCIQIGLLCVQEHPKDRPMMSSVALMLKSHLEPIQVPVKLAFIGTYDVSNNLRKRSIAILEACTPNEVSVEELVLEDDRSILLDEFSAEKYI